MTIDCRLKTVMIHIQALLNIKNVCRRYYAGKGDFVFQASYSHSAYLTAGTLEIKGTLKD